MSGWKPLRVDQSSIGDLADVDLSTPATDGQVLKYDDGSSTWVPAADDTGTGLPAASTKGDLAVYDGDSWEILAAGTDDHVLTADSGESVGLKWAAGGGGGGDSRLQAVAVTSQQTFTSATPAGVTELSVPVVSGKYYQFTARIIYQSSNTSIGIKLGMSGPSASVNIAYRIAIFTASATQSIAYRNVFSSTLDTTSVTVANGEFYAEAVGSFKAAADGTLQVIFASESTTQVSVEAGSTLTVIECD